VIAVVLIVYAAYANWLATLLAAAWRRPPTRADRGGRP
jgi:hypothetical protein